MRLSGLGLFLLPAFAAASPALEARVCGDNCARAVIASAFTTRHGAADCSSYLLTTVTPAISTITETSTLSFFPTVTVAVTETEIATTSVPFIAATVTVPSVATTTVTTTSTITTDWPGLGVRLKKRDEIVAPSLIPSYASACSGAARYSTACSCLGVFPSTTTVATPLETTTVYVSVSYTATATSIASIETDVVTATDIQTATTTLVSTTTVTAVATATVGAFRLQVTSGQYAGQYVKISNSLLVLGTSKSGSAVFTVDTLTNTLIDLNTGYPAYTASSTDNLSSAVGMLDPEVAAQYSQLYATATCWVSNSGGEMILICEEPNNHPLNTWAYTIGDLFLTSSDASCCGFDGSFTLKLVSV